MVPKDSGLNKTAFVIISVVLKINGESVKQRKTKIHTKIYTWGDVKLQGKKNYLRIWCKMMGEKGFRAKHVSFIFWLYEETWWFSETKLIIYIEYFLVLLTINASLCIQTLATEQDISIRPKDLWFSVGETRLSSY